MDHHNEKPVNSSKTTNTDQSPSSSSSSLSRTVYAHRIQNYSPLTYTSIKEYCNNEIKTSIYTIWNFLPKIIYEQLHYMSNIFFILVAIIHLFADGATSIFAIIGPFSFVLLVTMIKDIIYDLLRYYQDKQINEKKFFIMKINIETNEIYWILKKSKFIHVGDIILCKNNEEFPSDLIILSTSNLNNKCYITTVNIDGENTIKTHYCLLDTHNIYKKFLNENIIYNYNNNQYNNNNNNQFIDLLIKVNYQQPNEDFNNFEGYITILINNKKLLINNNNILYKGCKLKNTKYIIGLVIYTGNDTKLLLNSNKVKRKYTTRESKANQILFIFMIFMIIFCIIFAMVTKYWSFYHLNHIYIPFENLNSIWLQIKNVFRFLFILNYLIPISLIITTEIQQIMLSYFIRNDLNLYDFKQDLNTKSNTPQLVDELGQVNYLFSDKTGTLTLNEMNLYKIAILNIDKVYVLSDQKLQNTNDDNHYDDDHDHDHEKKDKKKREKDTNQSNRLKQILRRTNKFGHIGVVYEELNEYQNQYNQDNYGFISSSDSEFDEEDNNEQVSHLVLNKIYKSNETITSSNENLNNLSNNDNNNNQLPNELIISLTTLALCHTVEVSEDNEEKQNGTDETMCLDSFYQATSPDEKALVIGAAKLGIQFMGKLLNENNSHSRIYRLEYDQFLQNGSDQSEIMEYSIDAVLEFDSVRKRMSIMAKHPDGTYHIHSKGAESSIFEISNLSTGDLKQLASKYVTQFAINGLRTLVYASRQVDSKEYYQLLDEFYHANSLFGSERNDALKKIYSKIEYNLTLVSITGVEDKLQPGVHECLKNLRDAGIQVWVLTGDKEETAITVSRSAGHFTPNMNLVHLTNCKDFSNFAYKLFNYLENLKNFREKKRNLKKKMKQFFEKSINVIEMKTNNRIKIDFNYQNDFVDEKYLYNNNHNNNNKQLFISRSYKNVEDRPRYRHSKRPGSSGEPMALVIDGKSLRYALDPTLRKTFLNLCLHLTTVLCCRLTPLQKASVVQLVRSGFSEFGVTPITAAIGDGGNDVAMLLQANIGIGVYGKEGKEAVRASDYAIPQFKHLQRLLLVHGHQANYRICITMNLFYYKCVTFVTTQVLYTFYSGFSAVSTFETVLFSIYNLTVTSLMCMLFGIFERHLPDDILNANPYLYRRLKHQANLRSWYVCLWILDGIWHGTIIFYGATYFFTGGYYFSEGTFYDPRGNIQQLFDMSLYGCATYLFVWFSVSLRIFIASHDYTIVVFGGILTTLTVNIAILIALQSTTTLNNINFRSYTKLCRCPTFWFALPLILTIANLPSLLWRIISDAWWNLQIHLSSIPNKQIRRKYRRSPMVWFLALTTNYLTDSYDIFHRSEIRQDSS
uniref:Phospholipid-transporting ATPase n=1 Tax=Schistosoma mansoni TaxID=6183 RepID=A0A5K4FA05_SCHMA